MHACGHRIECEKGLFATEIKNAIEVFIFIFNAISGKTMGGKCRPFDMQYKYLMNQEECVNKKSSA
jgi:hypothetical protein